MQSYTEISSSLTLQNSLAPLLNNDKTIMSNNSGTSFPTANLQLGMWCFRTDQNKLYQLTDVANQTWALRFDFNAGVAHLPDVVRAPGGNAIDISGQDLNNIITSSFYRGNGLANAPDGGWWYVVVEAHDNGWVKQTASAYGSGNSVNAGTTYIRTRVSNTTWNPWKKVWTEDSLSKLSQLSNDPGFITSTLGQALNANGQEMRNAVLDAYRESITTANTGTAYAIDCSLSNVFNLTMTGNCTFSFSNVPASGAAFSLTLMLKQDATGGRTASWPASVKWSGGAAPTLTTTANKTDFITLTTIDGGTTWFGQMGGRNF